MERILHDISYLKQIMDLTSETLMLISAEGVCLDICSHTDLWFLQEDVILGKNILSLLPSHTYHKLIVDFQDVLINNKTITNSFRLPLNDTTYYGECRLMPFEGNVLCRYTDITNRENIKFKLTQAYEEMQEIQNIAKIGKWSLNIETNMIDYTGFCGENSEERKMPPISLDYYMEHFIIPEDREKMRIWVGKILRHPYKQRISYRISVMQNIYYMSVKCIYSEKDKQYKHSRKIEGIVQDVTEMHKRRNDISMLTHVIFNANESICGVFPDGTLKFANQIFRQVHGIGIDEDVSKYKIYNTGYGFAPNKDVWDERVQSMQTRVEMNFSYHNQQIDKDSEPVIYGGKFYKMTEDNGTYSYWAFAYDITQQVRYESEMKRYNQLMYTLFNNIPASISIKDVNDGFRFIYRNSINEDESRLQKDLMSAVRISDFDIFPKEEAWRIRKEDININETGEPLHRITQNIDADGELQYYDILKLKIDDPNFSPMILSIKWNITQLEIMKRKLVDAKQKAEESDRLKTIFLANISHEIRTPLNAIVGFSDIMAECDDQKQRKIYYKIIDQSTKRLLKFIEDILLLSRIESGEVKLTMVDISLNNLCHQVYDYIDGKIPPLVTVMFESSNKDITICLDEKYVIQIFMILIKTSCRFIEKEGNVWFGYVDKGDYVECYVKDSGKGLMNDGKEVFSLFTKYNYGNDGSELELTICYALVHLMGGNIIAQSTEGIGSKFVFILPK
jgi:Signal transduction histidine kinase